MDSPLLPRFIFNYSRRRLLPQLSKLLFLIIICLTVAASGIVLSCGTDDDSDDDDDSGDDDDSSEDPSCLSPEDCPDDGIFCNGEEFCDEETWQCDHTGDPCPDDGSYCNGEEFCDVSQEQCAHSGNPCDDGLWCNGADDCIEETDSCEHETTPEERCVDDGIWCNGVEYCDDEADECAHSGSPCPEDDGVFCNGEESCDEEARQCLHTGNPCPFDVIWCNGDEYCDEEQDACQSEYGAENPRCPDDGLWCNGLEYCNESTRACEVEPAPCPDDGWWCNGEELCNETTDTCYSEYSAETPRCPDDGLWCNGEEFCDESEELCDRTGGYCRPDVVCDDVNDRCGDAEFQVNTYTDHDQYRTTIAMHPDGGYVIVWDSMGADGDDWGICARQYDNTGMPQDDEFIVNTTTNSYQVAPAVNIFADDTFLIAWASVYWSNDSNGYSIIGQHFSSSALPVGSEFRVNTYLPDDQAYADIASNANGDFVIVWQSDDQDGDDFGIYGQSYHADGTPWGDEFLINQTTRNEQQTPTVGLDDSGVFFVAWEEKYQLYNGYGINGRRFSQPSTPLTDEFAVNTYYLNIQWTPEIAMMPSGESVVVWASNHQDGSELGVYGQRYDSAGAPDGEEFQVNTYTLEDQRDPSVAINASGESVIVWSSTVVTSEEPSGDATYNKGIFARRYDADGLPVGEEFQVNAYDSERQDDPSVAMDDDGRFVVVWLSDEQDGDDWGIFGMRFDADGTPMPYPGL